MSEATYWLLPILPPTFKPTLHHWAQMLHQSLGSRVSAGTYISDDSGMSQMRSLKMVPGTLTGQELNLKNLHRHIKTSKKAAMILTEDVNFNTCEAVHEH